ncbi:MAG: tetratricopeptide repeat protein [Proteobacteria bacterium]|nr:tetratricopeptide repeat protein [Pseudomonadota bacterium]
MTSRNSKSNKDQGNVDKMIAEITVDTYDDNETLWAFRQAFEDHVDLPADGFIIGVPVIVIEFDYDGNERRGLTAKCRREDGSEYRVAAADIVFPQFSAGANYIAAYRKWLNLDPFPVQDSKPSRRQQQHKATLDDIDLSRPVELVALSVKERVVRCRLLGSDRMITLRANHIWDVANDPITRANDLNAAGERADAIKILMDLCQSDLRCLDAHSHLGNFAFDHRPQVAIQHYEVGFRIGELSLGEDFTGVLPWGHIDNRPFLRCMHGYGSCLWRLGQFAEAEHIFQKMLWLNPSDNQGVRFLIDEVKTNTAWEDREND